MNRIALFLGGCMVVRLSFVYLAYTLPPHWVQWMSIPAALFGLSFILLNLFHLRQTGREVNYERIWWDPIRPVHGMFYLTFAYLAWTLHPQAYVPLAIDIVFGFLAFIWFHWLR
jgi:hypothetical protein